MADLKTTAEERAGLRAISADWFADRPDAQGARLLDDLDTLLAENAKLRAEVAYLADGRPLDAIRRTAAELVKLRAVAEAARKVRDKFGDDYEVRFSPLDAALAALGAP